MIHYGKITNTEINKYELNLNKNQKFNNKNKQQKIKENEIT